MQSETVGKVQSTLGTGLKSYIDVFASGHASQNHTTVTAKEIADIVKDAFQTEDWTRNVILHGVEEDGSYDVEKLTVSDLFIHAGIVYDL